VPDEDIAADYALSEGGLAAYREWASEHAPEVAAWMARVPPQLLQAPPKAMLDLLSWLRAQHGSIEAYAESIGVSAAAREALRARLLTRP